MKFISSYFLFCVFLSISLFAQQVDSVKSKPQLENYVRLTYENDFFSATDRYYTQGINFAFIHPIVRFSPASLALIRLNKRALNYYGLSFTQDCFTPRSIRYDTINYLERPYAATFFVSHTLTSINPEKKLLLQTQVDLGIIGPCARCEDEQKAIHKGLLNIRPLGWENQVKSDYIINYRIKIEKGIWMQRNTELMANAVMRVGTIYTDVGFGLNARIGFFSPYFNSLGLQKNAKTHIFKMFGVFKLNGKLVGYNATMQGGVFDETSVLKVPNDNINRFVLDGLAGVVIAYKRVSLEYSKTFLTPEFKGGLDHGWGRCVITVCF
jgi:lipid A 3-O-deacylase